MNIYIQLIIDVLNDYAGAEIYKTNSRSVRIYIIKLAKDVQLITIEFALAGFQVAFKVELCAFMFEIAAMALFEIITAPLVYIDVFVE